jgi:hypothetical protein
MGGKRFFPDAVFAARGTGRNVVRVRAEIEGASIGNTVYVRSFDVDDPSTNRTIDSKVKRVRDQGKLTVKELGEDNRGKLDPNDGHAPAKRNVAERGFKGQLRVVNEGTVLGDDWAAEDAIVEALVKEDSDGRLIAEVDLRTSFAPGDNFRVAASLDRDKLAEVPADSFPTADDVPGITGTPQLSVWRYLNIEVDASDVAMDGNPSIATSMKSLMTAETTVRQDNRLADAYIEPRYDMPNTTPLTPTLPATLVRGNTLSEPDQDFIDDARDSKGMNAPAFWVSYVGDASRLAPTRVRIHGITANDAAREPWQWSALFTADMSTFFGAANLATPVAKTAIHEIGHQLLGKGTGAHRGSDEDIAKYYDMTDDGKAKNLRDLMNIMNSDTVAVPMDNGTLSLPNPYNFKWKVKPTNNAGPYDQFYFAPADVVEIRTREHGTRK